MVQNNEKIEELWNIFKTGIQEAMDKYTFIKHLQKEKYSALVQ